MISAVNGGALVGVVVVTVVGEGLAVGIGKVVIVGLDVTGDDVEVSVDNRYAQATNPELKIINMPVMISERYQRPLLFIKLRSFGFCISPFFRYPLSFGYLIYHR